jgi:hypothetical protein
MSVHNREGIGLGTDGGKVVVTVEVYDEDGPVSSVRLSPRNAVRMAWYLLGHAWTAAFRSTPRP